MDLATSFLRIRIKSGKSRYKLAKFTGLDQAFLGRLENGTRRASRETLIKIALALVAESDTVSLQDVDGLLLDAGYAPLERPR